MMATSQVPEEVTCSICFEVYRDPRALRCLHTLCLPCIQKLDRGGKVRCPFCNVLTCISDIEKNLRIERLLEVEISYQDPVSSNCGICKNFEETVKFLCRECNYFICDSCEKTHREMDELKPHTVITVSEMIQRYQKNLETTCVEELEKMLQHIDEKSVNITTETAEIKNSMDIQIAQVDRYTQDAIETLKENKNHLKEVIEDVKTTMVRNLTGKQHIYERSKRQIQDQIKILKEIIQCEDFQTLKDNSENIKENIKEQIKEIKASLPEVDEMPQPLVTVIRNTSWDVKDFIQVLEHKPVWNGKSISHQKGQPIKPVLSEGLKLVSTPLYSSLSEKKWVGNKILSKTTHCCYKLCEINDQIWIAGNDRLTVINKNCEKVKTFRLKKFGDARSMALYNNNQVIIASQSSGVHSMNTKGQYLTCIMSGKFSDVFAHDGYLYALKFTKQDVFVKGRRLEFCRPSLVTLIYKEQEEEEPCKWEELSQISLDYGQGSHFDRIFVNKTGIYVSSFLNEHIYVYNVNGELVNKMKCGKHVVLCHVDEVGCCLVVNRLYHTLYALHNNTWKPFTLIGKTLVDKDGNAIKEQMKWYLHSLVDKDGNLWMGTYTKKLILYEKCCN